MQHNSVIYAFCMGVRSAELSGKVLSKHFESFSEALSFATNVDSAVQNRKAVSKPQQEAQTHTQTEAEATAYKGMVGNEVNSLDISETERKKFLSSRNGKNVDNISSYHIANSQSPLIVKLLAPDYVIIILEITILDFI